MVVSEIADFEYKCTDYYNVSAEVGVIWNDPEVGIEWPIKDPQLSKKDVALPTLAPGPRRAGMQSSRAPLGASGDGRGDGGRLVTTVAHAIVVR